MNKWKLIIGIAVAAILIGGGFYLGSGMTGRATDRKVEEARQEAEQLRKEKQALEASWQKKEGGYASRIKSLDDRLKTKQGEVDVLEKKLKDLRTELENIVIPDSPDDIVAEFRKSGYSSATRVKKPK